MQAKSVADRSHPVSKFSRLSRSQPFEETLLKQPQDPVYCVVSREMRSGAAIGVAPAKKLHFFWSLHEPWRISQPSTYSCFSAFVRWRNGRLITK
jgi:hypothetical protein